ncbi:hypothetical protein Tco_1567378, partial [Tanacetum coccineum]
DPTRNFRFEMVYFHIIPPTPLWKEIDLSSFWDRKSEDTALKVKFVTKADTPARLVRGYVHAYYGDEFLYKCQSETISKECYMALLFRAAPSYELTAGDISLIKSFLAVPTKGSLIIKAFLQDVNFGKPAYFY